MFSYRRVKSYRYFLSSKQYTKNIDTDVHSVRKCSNMHNLLSNTLIACRVKSEVQKIQMIANKDNYLYMLSPGHVSDQEEWRWACRGSPSSGLASRCSTDSSSASSDQNLERQGRLRLEWMDR